MRHATGKHCRIRITSSAGPDERVDFTIGTPAPLRSLWTGLRRRRPYGNYAYETVLVNIEAQAGKQVIDERRD